MLADDEDYKLSIGRSSVRIISGLLSEGVSISSPAARSLGRRQAKTSPGETLHPHVCIDARRDEQSTKVECLTQLPHSFSPTQSHQTTDCRVRPDTRYRNIHVQHSLKVSKSAGQTITILSSIVVPWCNTHVTQVLLNVSKPSDHLHSHSEACLPSRYHYNISINAPLHILSCHATPASCTLPAFTPYNVPLGRPSRDSRQESPSEYNAALNPRVQKLVENETYPPAYSLQRVGTAQYQEFIVHEK